MKKFIPVIFIIGFLLTSCSGEDSGNIGASDCQLNNPAERISGAPFGVLLPSGQFDQHSYKSAQEIKDAGYNAVSLSASFYFTQEGEIVYDRDSSRGSKETWLENIRCKAIEAKNAGLITLIWGQFEQADQARGQEPMGVPKGIEDKLAQGALELIPDVAGLLEELKVEYWSPVSELDKFLGYQNHNKYFAQMIQAGSDFQGITYAQPLTGSMPPTFYSEQVPPDFGGAKAMSISWISFTCFDDDIEKANWIIEQAKEQGVSEIFIGEIGGTQNKTDADQTCFETLVDAFNGKTTGVIALDMPDGFPNGSQVKGTWQETLITSYAQ